MQPSRSHNRLAIIIAMVSFIVILSSVMLYLTQTAYSQTKEVVRGYIPKTWGKLMTAYFEPGRNDLKVMVFQADDGTIRFVTDNAVERASYREDVPEATVYKRK